MTKRQSLVYLAKLGIVISTNEKGDTDIQRIDNPLEFKQEHNLKFISPLLKNDDEAKKIYRSLTLNETKVLIL